ncbi:hypothetical protein ACFV6E_13045 [Streptomyces sp. NPDC059785]|uniref:hypothetical protein n=1 Tax=Streptomyces sp. NPDC059785 TaxID=3346945 RepID=UPI0036623A48
MLTGCQRLTDAPDNPSTAPRQGGVAGTHASGPSPHPYGSAFLGVDECSSFGRRGTADVTEVPCTSERAAARVVARHDGGAADGPPCPATTDFVLHISEARPAADEDGDGTVPQGYACMRALEGPHPGDPGGGGGPHTIVGDCVYGAGGGQVRETACDGGGARQPEYEVTEAVTDRRRCPAETVLYVRLGGSHPVGCARPL